MKTTIHSIFALLTTSSALFLVACGGPQSAKNTEAVSLTLPQGAAAPAPTPTVTNDRSRTSDSITDYSKVSVFTLDGIVEFYGSEDAPVNGIKDYFGPGGQTLKVITASLGVVEITYGYMATNGKYDQYFQDGGIEDGQLKHSVVIPSYPQDIERLAEIYGLTSEGILVELSKIAIQRGSFEDAITHLDFILQDRLPMDGVI